MPKIEKDLLKVKGSDGQWHYIPAVGGGDTPKWEMVQNKPFESLGDGLSVENGVLSAKGGTGGSSNAVQYVAQTLTDEQKAQARENIGAKAATEKSAYIISKTRSYGYIHTDGMDFDGVYAQIQSGKVVMLLVDNNATYYGVITTVTDKTIVFYNIRDMSQSDVGGRNKGITYFGFTWHKGDDSLTEWWGDIPSVEVDETLTKSGSAADAKAVGDALQNYVPAENYEENLQEIAQAIGTKLDKNQGAGNAGKILGIGEDGIVVPQDKPSGSSVTVDDALSSTSENPVQNKVVTAALAEKITAPATAAVGQIIKVKSVDTSGKPTEWEAVDMPSGGTEKEWTKILEVEVTEATAAFEVTGLDNYTEFLTINSELQNATSTDSAQNLYINGIRVCVNFVDVPKSGGLAYNYAIAKYNGMVWECHKAGKAISATNLAPSTAYIPYNVVFGVGKATSIKMATANTTYAPVSGKITIYGR